VVIQAPAAAPRIECREPVHDFGSLCSTQIVTHTFRIGNAGDGDLSILSLRECCGATIQLADRLVAPGTSTALSVTLSLRGREGKQRKSFYVISDDPVQPYYRVALQGHVTRAPGDRAAADDDRATTAGAGNVGLATNRAAASLRAGGLSNAPPVVVDYFFEIGCPDCLRIERRVLPRLSERFDGLFELRRLDLDSPSNVVRLLRYQEVLGVGENAPVSVVVDYRHVLGSYAEIETGLVACVEQGLRERLSPRWRPPQPIVVDVARWPSLVIAARRVRAYTVPMIAAAGLADGLNLCAASTLVFFVSVLSMAGVRGRRMLALGACFCLGSFLTYLGLGFGLLAAVRATAAYGWLRAAVEWGMLAALLVLAWLSFRDAIRYRRSGSAEAVTLQLPGAAKRAAHAVMRRGARSAHLAAAGLGIGAAVTLLESVCTGQVYLPALVLIVKSGAAGPKTWGYLLLYNTMFIVPLAGVFWVAYRGVAATRLAEWTRRHVAATKLATGALFIALAALIAVL
jgi:hypothetical protein